MPSFDSVFRTLGVVLLLLAQIAVAQNTTAAAPTSPPATHAPAPPTTAPYQPLALGYHALIALGVVLFIAVVVLVHNRIMKRQQERFLQETHADLIVDDEY